MLTLHAARTACRHAALALPLAIAACVGLEPMPAPEPAHQLTVERIDYRHTVYFDTDRDRPSAEERRRLRRLPRRPRSAAATELSPVRACRRPCQRGLQCRPVGASHPRHRPADPRMGLRGRRDRDLGVRREGSGPAGSVGCGMGPQSPRRRRRRWLDGRAAGLPGLVTRPGRHHAQPAARQSGLCHAQQPGPDGGRSR